jgi:preprotein translocase subunit YajC
MLEFLIPAAHAQAGGQAPAGGEMMQIVFMIGIFVIFYFMLIRPQRKRQKEVQQMQEGLQVGDEVVTTAGLLGKIRKIEDDFVVLKVAENVELKFQKMAMHAVLPKGTIKSIDS